ncbi:hypothetical protein evm_009262 [Chilo suppressalis]|nr:hypothetical protein evm_009262 [Chilo suppressalis]
MSREVDVKALISHIVRGDGADKCRICMGDTSEGQVYLGDTVMMDGERPVTLAELLEVITGVEVPEVAELPNGLCSTCSGSAVDAANFSILCRQANTCWNTTLKLLNDIPSASLLPDLSKAIYAILNDNQINLIYNYNDSIVEKDSLGKTGKHRSRKNCKAMLCQCPNCDKKFRHPHELSHHLKESGDYQRACHICAGIMSRDKLIDHLRLTHEITPYDCKKCPALFHSQMKYIRHLKEAHTSGACTCGDCGRTFQSQFGYHAHQSVHLLKTCPACDKLFRNQMCYIHHSKVCCKLDKIKSGRNGTKHKVTVKNKSSSKKVKVGLRGSANNECICDYCGKKLSSKKFIKAHIQHVHMKNTHMPCPYCGKSLAAAHMTEHIKTHELVRLYKCEHCNLVLKSRLGFIQHLRLHTGERPFACKHCGETFSASSRRSEHIRKVHNGGIELKHECKLCSSKFSLPFRLRRHMAAVHSEESEQSVFECNECHEKFSSCRGLIHHSRKHQKDAVPQPRRKLVKLKSV